MSPEVTIRPFRAGDEEPVVALWRAAGLVVPWNDPHRDIARKLTTQPDLFLVAEHGGAVVGTVMAGYDGHRGWVNYLAVAPQAKRSGLGRRLMAAAEAKLAALGCTKVNLQVRTGNAAAAAFYEALGYRRDAVVSYGKRLVVDGAGASAVGACVAYEKDTGAEVGHA